MPIWPGLAGSGQHQRLIDASASWTADGRVLELCVESFIALGGLARRRPAWRLRARLALGLVQMRRSELLAAIATGEAALAQAGSHPLDRAYALALLAEAQCRSQRQPDTALGRAREAAALLQRRGVQGGRGRRGCR